MSLLTVMAEDFGDNLDSWEDQVDSGVIHDQQLNFKQSSCSSKINFLFCHVVNIRKLKFNSSNVIFVFICKTRFWEH